MTYKEAHTFLEVKQREMTRNRYLYNEKAININGLAILALEKQIPKKPKRDKEYSLGRVCPKCHDYLGNVQFITHHCNYCKNCGQALDWSDIE